MSSHPLHPGLVHWPIALLTTSFGIDALLRPLLVSYPNQLPTSIVTLLPNSPTELSRLSYYALSAGLLAALPALVSGGIQAVVLIQKIGDWYETDPTAKTSGSARGAPPKRLKPKLKLLFTHAALNDVVLLAAGVYWWVRRQQGGPAYVPDQAWMMGLSAGLAVVTLYAAALGGTLTYNYGAGMNIASAGKKKRG